jgi:signal transduction histidine kinase
MFHSYRTRLMVALAGVAVASQLIAAILFLTRLPAVSTQARLDELRDQTSLLAGQLFPAGVPTLLSPDTRQRLTDAASLLRGGILVADGRGTVLHAAGDTDLPTKMVALGALGQVLAQDAVIVADVPSAQVHRVLLGTPVRGPAGKDGVLLVAVPVTELSQPAQTLLPAIATALGIALVLSLLAAAVLAQAVAAPVQRLTAAVEAMARGDYGQQVAVTSADELGRLSTRFNEMTREVARSRQTLKDFTVNVSHDLKTPVSIIQGFAEALADGVAADPAEQLVAVKAIRREADKMGRLVQELLDLARLESGQVTLACEPVNLGQLARGLAARYGSMAESAGQQLTVELADDLPAVRGDPAYLERAIANLLDNALRYTPAGGQICLTGYAIRGAGQVGPPLIPSPASGGGRGRGPAGDWTVIAVADTGPGIPPEDLGRLFERFYQVDKSRSRGRGETGLGLAIVKEIVEQHGGQVWVRSEPGQGAEFAIALPSQSSVFSPQSAVSGRRTED